MAPTEADLEEWKLGEVNVQHRQRFGVRGFIFTRGVGANCSSERHQGRKSLIGFGVF
jgi:hypothetical protein